MLTLGDVSNTSWEIATVAALQAEGSLLVEDGNHGEYRPRPTEFVDDGTPFIRAADMENGRILFDSASRINEIALKRIRKGIGKPGDILLSHKGTVGKLALAGMDCEPFVCSPQTTFWRVRNEGRIERRFLYAYMESSMFVDQLNSRKGETDMADYVSLTAQRGLRVILPPLPEQRAIAHILGTLDDKIELNRRTNRTLEEIARALFTSWFVAFNPVRAKAAGRQPDGMDAATAALFPDSFHTSGTAPLGWKVGETSDLARLARRSLNPSLCPDEIFDHYSLPAFDHGREPVMEAGKSIKSNKTLVDPSAILLSKLNPHIPRVWLPQLGTKRRAIGSTEFLVMIPHHANARHFVYSLLVSDAFSQMFASIVTGTTGSHQRVSPQSLLASPVVVPPEQVILRYAEVVAPLFARIAANLRESSVLADLRDALLPRLLSGELATNQEGL